MNTQRRLPELDGIRGLACIAVVLFHAYPTSPFFWAWSTPDLFFVLSGFLITTIILRQRDSDGFLLSYYLRRGFRIWPLYYLTLAGVLLVNHFSASGWPTTGMASHLLFLQNCQIYFGTPPPPFIHTFSPSWTVAVEEQYYLIWPLLLLWLGRRSVPYLAASLLAISLIGRLILPDAIDLLGTRGDGLAFGCFLAWLVQTRGSPTSNRKVQRVIWIAGVTGGIYVSVYLLRFGIDPHPQWISTCFTGFSLLFFGIIGLCIINSGAPLLAPLRHPVVRWFGTISYAMYMFHLPIMTYFPTILSRAGWHSIALEIALTWLLVVGLPATSWYLLEQPILRWKESLIPLRPETEAIVRAVRTPTAQLP